MPCHDVIAKCIHGGGDGGGGSAKLRNKDQLAKHDAIIVQNGTLPKPTLVLEQKKRLYANAKHNRDILDLLTASRAFALNCV